MDVTIRSEDAGHRPQKGELFKYTTGTETYMMCVDGGRTTPSTFVQLTGDKGAGTVHYCIIGGGAGILLLQQTAHLQVEAA